MTSDELKTKVSTRLDKIEAKIRNGYDGQAELEIVEKHGSAHFVFRVPTGYEFESFRRHIAIDNDFVNVMIKCGNARFQ